MSGRIPTILVNQPTTPTETHRPGLRILDFVLVHEREQRLEEKVDFACVAANDLR